MKTRLSSPLLGVLLLFTMHVRANAATAFTGFSSANQITMESPFSGGDGSAVDPFQISTASELNQVRDYLSAHFILTEDINLDIAPYNTGEGWVPIGDENNSFTGTFNGNGKVVSNLYINREGSYQGLFANVSGSTITNLALIDLSITIGGVTHFYIGGLAGNIVNGEVTGITASGSITGEVTEYMAWIGGLIGFADGLTIENSTLGVDISIEAPNGADYAGGVIGEVDGITTINEVVSTGHVIGSGGVDYEMLSFGGLVGGASGSSLTITNSSASGNVTADWNIGGFLGEVRAASTQITNSSASGTVTSLNRGRYVGGFIGDARFATVTNSIATGDVIVQEGGREVGGFYGEARNLTTSESYATGNVTAPSTTGQSVGGFVGRAFNVDISNSYALGETSGNDRIGGFVGFLEDVNSVISNSFAFSGAIGITNVGGFVGEKEENTTLTNVFWNSDATTVDNELGIALTTVQMRRSANFDGFDFTDVWAIAEGASIPYLQETETSVLPAFVFTAGDGSAEAPYEISTPEQLNGMRAFLSANYMLTSDIDLTDETREGGLFWNDGNGWEPIGTNVAGFDFTGTLDGEGHVIRGLFSNRGTNRVGLFGLAAEATISSLALEEVDVSGSNDVGALVGQLVNGTISNVRVSGSISGNDRVGGIVGNLSFASSTINSSYSTAQVTGVDNVGGIVGNINGGATINTSYSTGLTSGNSFVGGLVGSITSSAGTVTNSYWNTSSGSPNNGIGTGLTSNQMRQNASFAGFNFETTWQSNAPNAFPTLKSSPEFPAPGFLPIVGTGSLSFDGVNDYVSIPHSEVYDDLDVVTIELWINPETLSGQQGIMEKHVSPTSGWWLRLNGSSLQVLFVTPGTNPSGTASGAIEVNRWQHVVAQYDGSNVKIYVDGKLQSLSSSATGSGLVSNNANNILLGRLNWTAGTYFNGKMDEVRIWNVLRTESEIQQNMHQPLNGDEAGLIGYYRFEEGTGSSTDDYSPNNNTAQLVNGVSWSAEKPPYGTIISGTEGWRMMSFPFDDASYGTLLESVWTQGFPGADSPDIGDPNVYIYDEAVQDFVSVADANDIPTPGSGLIVYVFDDVDFDGNPDGFPKVLRFDNAQVFGSVSLSLSYTESGDAESRGWNLVGNPYGATIDWDASTGWTSSNLDATYYVWNADAAEYQSWNGFAGTTAVENGLIAPFQGFWVKANATDPVLTLTDEVRSAGGVFMKQNITPRIRLSLQNGELTSSSVLMLHNEASSEKDRLDAYKLQSLNTDFLSLFTILQDGTGLDINALPSNLTESVSIPIGIEGSNLVGDAEFSWSMQALPEGWRFVLRDTQLGTETDLSTTSSITFTLNDAALKLATHDANLSPRHGLISPNVMRAKSSDEDGKTRFVLDIHPIGSTSIDPSELPVHTALMQNYPNPFNPSTTIKYALPEVSTVRLDVYDMLGRRVATLVNSDTHAAGYHTVIFDASRLASGVYIYRLQAGSTTITRKLTLIK